MHIKVRTQPDLAENSIPHIDAVLAGKEHFFKASRNVIDEFKSSSNEEIRAKLKETAFPYAVCFENFIADINIASGIRNANAFNAENIFYIGEKRFDRRGTTGVMTYSDVHWLSEVNDLIELKKEYLFVGFDNIAGSVPMNDYDWGFDSGRKVLIIFGSEGVGLTTGMQALCEDFVYIKQFGSVRSLNVATASGIAMNDFVSKFEKRKKAI